GGGLAGTGRAGAVAAVGVGAAEGDDLGVGGRVGAAGAVAEDGDEPVHAAVARVGARARPLRERAVAVHVARHVDLVARGAGAERRDGDVVADVEAGATAAHAPG